ncbi:hypothetical protein HPB50_006055 [Hyalomma asiaticum]|uniref:Uncharacterized protein n=1 Tax=Hyalomma asiaticum TaxID=266040 RepID=A0ACB7SIG3_HYAAI|nr:hypothetical protein HPB50_006055 [Hyalomma asiaticum]
MNALRSTLFLFIDSSQFTPVYPESPVAGPSGLSTCGRSDERVPCQETSGQKKQTSAQPHRGPNRKVYSPKTTAVIKRLKNDAQRYRKAARLKSRRKITTQEALEKLKHRVNPQFYELMNDGSERTTAVANVAFVALLSGISRSWVMPVAFTAAKTALRAENIKRLLLALIAQLAECQLYVKAVVCDQGSSNIKLFDELAATPQNPYFEVNGHKVYFFFDTPHLLKCTRNNLRAPHKLFIGTEIVDWSYIRELYECSDPHRVKLARKLTSDHIYRRPFNSMKVKFAAQVLSESVSVAMSVMISLGKLPATAKSTADFIEHIDKLFDCLNSKTATASTPGKMNYALSATSEHLAFLREAIKWISCWRFDSPRQPHTIRGWLVTIQAALMLWEDLHQNFNFTCLLTRRLQQDSLENLFGTLRQKHGCNEHPNVFQFIAALKHVFVGKLSNLSSRGNCELVDSHLLARLSVGEPRAQQAVVTETLFPSETSGEDLLDITEENALYCFAGGITQRFLENRPADCTCEPLLRSGDPAFSGSHQTLAMLQSHGLPRDDSSNADSAPGLSPSEGGSIEDFKVDGLGRSVAHGRYTSGTTSSVSFRRVSETGAGQHARAAEPDSAQLWQHHQPVMGPS